MLDLRAVAKWLALSFLPWVLLGCTDVGSWDQLTADLAALEWGYRIPLTVDNSGVATTQSGVPALVRLTPDRFPYDKMSGTSDIGFFDDAGAELPYEVEVWDPGGESRLWVRISQVPPAGTPARIWIYFGSLGKEGRRDSEATWEEFAAVWHLGSGEAETGILLDSSGRGNHLVNGFGGATAYASADGVLGDAGGAVEAQAPTDALVVLDGSRLAGLGPLTYEVWFQDVVPLEDSGPRLLRKGPLFLWIDGVGRIALTVNYSDTNLYKQAAIAWPADSWWHLAVTWDGGPAESGVRFFENGVDAGSSNRNDAVGSRDDDSGVGQTVGNSAVGDSNAPGARFDEIRISSVARSPGWLLLSMRGSSDQLFSFGPAEKR